MIWKRLRQMQETIAMIRMDTRLIRKELGEIRDMMREMSGDEDGETESEITIKIE